MTTTDDPLLQPLPRRASVRRTTRETRVELDLDLDGDGRVDAATGLPFLDHMLSALGLCARFALVVRASGDLVVDDHHTVEDVALALGRALQEALGERRGIARFGEATAPLDEALVRVVVDLSGRPWPEVRVPFARERIGTVSTENLVHFLRTLATAGAMALHVDLLRGENDHHKAEAAFKATGLALRRAIARDGDLVASTKGVLS